MILFSPEVIWVPNFVVTNETCGSGWVAKDIECLLVAFASRCLETEIDLKIIRVIEKHPLHEELLDNLRRALLV